MANTGQERCSEVAAILAESLGHERLQVAKDTFDELDANQDGKIELEEALDHFLSEQREKLVQQFRYYDANQDGCIDFEEYLLAFVPGTPMILKFREFDTDGDGLLSQDEILKLAETLVLPLGGKLLLSLIERADKDGDNKLTFYEFFGLMSHYGFQ